TLDVAEHRLGLGRAARLDHDQVAAQVDDVVDVLDRDGADLDAGPTGDAVPDHLLGHAVLGDRLLALREDLVTDAHDQELRGEDLPGRPRRAGVLAAAA